MAFFCNIFVNTAQKRFVFRSLNTKFHYTLRKQFCQINKIILLVFMQKNSFVVPKKHFSISIKFWLLKQNVLSGQQKKFCCINFFLSVHSEKISDWIKKIICLKHFLWCKEIFGLNETKFDSNKISLEQISICLNQMNFCLESNKFYLWQYINALISLFWRKINLIQTNIYLVQRYFVWI